jgi:hypothetical protein
LAGVIKPNGSLDAQSCGRLKIFNWQEAKRKKASPENGFQLGFLFSFILLPLPNQWITTLFATFNAKITTN